MDPLNHSDEFIKAIFTRGGAIILELSDELRELELKFGQSSSLVSKKSLQLSRLVEFYENCRKLHEEYAHNLKLSEVMNSAYQLVLSSIDTGVHTDRLLALMQPHAKQD